MSGMRRPSAKRSHPKNMFAFPDDIDIPEAALSDRKFLSCYVNILNDPRVYKRRRLNGDRTSSRFDVDNNITVKVIFNEPPVKRKSILANAHNTSKDDSSATTPKSVSFSSKITIIDSVDLDGASSDWTDVEIDESHDKSKKRSKNSKKKNGQSEHSPKKASKTAAVSNDKPSSKNKKKTKGKPSSSSGNRNGHKVKSGQKELFKFKITKPFRKYGRVKEKKLKHLQKKFGRRMFKAFVQVKRSFNLKSIPAKVNVPLEKITLKMNDVTTISTPTSITTTTTMPVKSVPSIQEFLIGQMTKTVKVSLTPVHGNKTDELTNEQPMMTTVANDGNDTATDEIMQCNEIELNSFETNGTNSIRTENGDNVPSDNSVGRQEIENDSEMTVATTASNESSCMTSDSDQHTIRHTMDDLNETNQINGESVSTDSRDAVVENIVPYNDTNPSPELLSDRESNALPNVDDDKTTCNMRYNNTNNDVTAPTNGRMLVDATDDVTDVTDIKSGGDHHRHQNITSTFNVSFSMPATKSLTDNNILDGCDSPQIASIQLND